MMTTMATAINTKIMTTTVKIPTMGTSRIGSSGAKDAIEILGVVVDDEDVLLVAFNVETLNSNASDLRVPLWALIRSL